jgi:tetratricopeptide (TPR) repeat protein
MSYSLTSVGVSNFHTAYNGDAASVQPDAPSHESQVTTDSMPMLGISMVGIDEFIGRCGGEACLEGLETAQVCEKFIVPMTIETKSSYVEYIDGCAARRRVPCLQLVSRANLFISHAWRYKFLAVVSALRQFLASNKNKQGTPETVYVWFDLFTNSQHESTCVIRPFSWWSGTFLNAIKSIGWLLLVLEPSDNPVIFTRVWCIWELYCAYVSGCRIDAGMSEAELGRFHRRILLDSQSCDWDFDQERSNFFAMVAHIDIRAADAMRPSDKAQIFAVIEGTVGFHALNSTVTDCLRQWVIADFQRTMESIDSSSGTNCELYEEQKQDLKNMLDVRRKNRVPVDASMLHYKQALANLYRQVGNYNAAVELLEKCQRGYETYEVGDIQDVARVMACRLRLAECYCMLGRPRRAAELLKSINVDSGVTLGGSLLLHCLVRTADPAYLAEADRLAISMVQDQLGSKALRDWAELPALTSVPAIHSCIQLAEVHVAQGRVDDAQSVLTHVLASAEGVFRDSVDVSVNLIESFYPWPSDKCHKSSKLVLPVAARCIRPCIVRAIHLLAHVSMTKKDFRKAVALNGFIAELCREKFGGNHPDTLTAVSNLAVSYFCLGLDMKCEDETSLDARNVFEQAEELLRLCHARRATVFGSAHAICLSTLNNVAVVVRHLGRPKEAEDLLMEALQARPSAEGKYPAAESVDVDHLICRYNWTAVRLRNIDLRVQHPKNRARDSRVLEDCTADLRPILQDLKMIAVLSAGSIDDPPRQRSPIAVIKAEASGSASQLVTVDHESHGFAADNGGNSGLLAMPSPGGQQGLAIHCPEKTEGFNAPADGRPLTLSPSHKRKTKIFRTASVNSGPNAPPSPRSPRSPVSERSTSGNSATPHGTPEPLSRTPDLERGHLNNGNYSLGDSLEVEQFLLPPTAGPVPVPVPVPRFSALSSMKRPLSETSIGDGVVGGAGMGSDGNASCRKVRLVSSSRNVAVESPVPTPVAGTGAGSVTDTASSGHGSGTATSDGVGTVTSRKSGTVTYAEDSDMFVDYSYHDSIGAYTDIAGFNICEPCRPSMLPLEETIEVDAKYVFSKFCELRICSHDFSVVVFFQIST